MTSKRQLTTSLILAVSILFSFLGSCLETRAEYINSNQVLGAPIYYFDEVQNRLARSSGFVFSEATVLYAAQKISALTGLKIVVDSSIKDRLVSFIMNGTAAQALITAATQVQAFVNLRNGYLEISPSATFVCQLAHPLSHRDLQSLYYLVEGSPSVLYVDALTLKAHLDYPTFMKFKESAAPMKIVKSSLLFEDSL